MQSFVTERIEKNRQQGLSRKRVIHSAADSKLYCENDYLGLAKDERIIQALQHSANVHGVGGCASQLVAGHQEVHQQLEREFAEFLQREAALLFTNGYMANCGVISALVGRHDGVIADKEVHASLLDAIKMSGATLKRYAHLDYEQLDHQLSYTFNKKLVITDSVFSMRGDIADLPTCAELAKKHDATLLVDDAHGIGILGESGAGCQEYFGLNQAQLPILICPLAKAFGVMGAVVAGSRALVDYLTQFARSYIYTTAIPPAMASAALTALKIVKKERWRRDKLAELVSVFKESAAHFDLPVLDSTTPIQCINFADIDLGQKVADRLFENGIVLKAMRPPTVPANMTCLRVTLTVKHNANELRALLKTIRKIYDSLR